MAKFKIDSEYRPSGDQPSAIKGICEALDSGVDAVTLLGVTGSGKTFTMANVIEKLQRPALILSHNKTLAAQLYGEFKSFFPNNAVEYFVSYYDYYQPEAYVPSSDTYIEKDLDAFYKGKSEDYLTWLLKTLSFKYRNNTNVDANHDNAFNKVINHDLSLFNELYKPLNNYESCVMTGKYVNDTLITDGFFRSEAWKYTLNIPRIQVENHQTYIMIFKNGELVNKLVGAYPKEKIVELLEI